MYTEFKKMLCRCVVTLGATQGDSCRNEKEIGFTLIERYAAQTSNQEASGNNTETEVKWPG
jgi:hypothetical protein